MDYKKWIYYTNDEAKIQEISQKFNISPMIAAVILNRGIHELEDIEKYIDKNITKFHDPLLMKDMDKAVSRIKEAISYNQKITVYGDYDVDGVTSTSILVDYLLKCGADVNYYIPDRIDEGYGINKNALEKLKQEGTELIITVDSGITAIEETNYATGLGLDIIITDHHECKEEIPNAYAVINPKQKGCQYPFKDFAGVGVTFKLIQALAGQEKLMEVMNDYCEIVCLGTIADVVPLLGENRLIVYYGLNKMHDTHHLGLKALIKVSGISSEKKISTGFIGFGLAPRINAAGRVGSALRAVELFLTNDPKKADEIAYELNEENKNRQETEAQILEEALGMIEKDIDLSEQKVIVLSGANWNHGVIGIVASRITEKYYRPTILISIDGDEGKGSGRSISDFNLFKALSACNDDLVKFGGHEQAAGLTLGAEIIALFSKHLQSYAQETLCDDDLIPRIYIDYNINIENLSFETIRQLEVLEPFGMGNAGPIFSLQNVVISSLRTVGEGKHLKLTLEQDGKYIDAIGFNMGAYEQKFITQDVVDVAGSLGINTYKGKDSVQLIIRDIKMPEHKINEAKYYKTFDVSMRSDIINNVTVNIKNLDNEQKEFIDVIKESECEQNEQRKNLILVHTRFGAEHVIEEIKKNNISCKTALVHYNNVECSSDLDIVINPILEQLNIQAYDKVYIYDSPFTLENLTNIANHHSNVQLIFNTDRFFWCDKTLKSIVPNRQDFVVIYQYIKTRSVEGLYSDDISLLVRRIKVSYNLPMNCAKLKSCLGIFEELGLLIYSINNDEIQIKLLDHKGKKVNIESSIGLAKIRNLNHRFNDCKKYIINQIK